MSSYRTSRRRTSIALALLLVGGSLAMLAPPASAAATLVVCDAGCAYATIDAALADAVAGDTVVVRPGTYVGALELAAGVTLCSTSASGTSCAPHAASTILEGTATAGPVRIVADGATVRGFTLRNPAFDATNEDAGAPVEAALVVVAADGASILDNRFTQPAGDLPAFRSRAYTSAVAIRAGSDDVTVARNTMADFPAALGAGATCAHAPCEVVAVRHEGGSGFLVERNDIRILETGAPATAIEFADNAGVVIRDNFLRLPGSAPGSPPLVTGIETTRSASGVVVERNDIATGLLETHYGLYGVFGVFRDSVFRDNEIKTAQHGLMLRTSAAGGNLVEGNYFFDNNQAILNFANHTTIRDNRFYLGHTAVLLDAVFPQSSTGVVLRDNEFRNHTRWIATTATVLDTYVDARENDWGSYARDLIQARIHDETGTNEIDISCFIDRDGVTRVCPSASFTDSVENTAWPRQIRVVDASVSGGRSIASRVWTLPDGSESTAPEAVFSTAPGIATVTLSVTDTEGFTDTLTRDIAVPNTAPTLSLPASLLVTEGSTVSFALAGADAEGDTLSYTMSDAPTGATLDAATGAFSWSVPYDADGVVYAVTFTASDGVETTSAPLSIEVSDTPAPPALAPLGSRSVLENGALSVDVTAIDPDGGIVALTAAALPTGATFTDHGDNTGTFAWTPPTGAAGTYVIDVTATAANGLTDVEQLLVTVTAEAGVSLTRDGAFVVQGAPGQVIRLPATLLNIGTGPDTFTLAARSSAPGWTTAAGNGPSLGHGQSATVEAFVAIPAGGGTSTVTLRACSGADAARCQEVSWSVRTPLVVSVTMESSFHATEDVAGALTVTWLDGAPVEGARVGIREVGRLVPLASGVEVRTDELGHASFVLGSPSARTPGLHDVTFAATAAGNGAGSAVRSYSATL